MHLRHIKNLLAMLLLPTLSSIAVADMKPSSEEILKLKNSLASLGCRGGHMEKERDGTYEVEDTRCPDGKFEIEFDSNFAVLKRERD